MISLPHLSTPRGFSSAILLMNDLGVQRLCGDKKQSLTIEEHCLDRSCFTVVACLVEDFSENLCCIVLNVK